MEADESRAAHGRPLHRGAAHASPRPAVHGTGPQVQGDDDLGHDGTAYGGSRNAAVQGDATEPALAGRSDLCRDLAWVRVRGVCDRRLLAPDRGMAGVELVA